MIRLEFKIMCDDCMYYYLCKIYNFGKFCEEYEEDI